MRRANRVKQPLYLELKNALLREMENGEFPLGASLPSERRMERLFSVSRVSIRKALEELEADGAIEKSRGRRSVVMRAGRASVRWMAAVTSLDKERLFAVYGMLHEELLRHCLDNGIELSYVNASKELPPFQKAARYDAVFVMGDVSPSTLAELKKPGVRFIALDDTQDSFETPLVCVDGEKGGAQAARILIEKGRRKLLLLGVEDAYARYKPFRQRRAGFLAAAKEAGCECETLDVKTDDPAIVKRRLAETSGRFKFNGLFAFNDHLAATALACMAGLGARVPDDIAVVGFDGLELGSYTSPSLTTIAQPVGEIARKAFEMATAKEFPPANASIRMEGVETYRESA